MLIYDKLDKIADQADIPNEIHPYLHVNCKESWVETVVELIESKKIKRDPKIIKILTENWECLLYNRYSFLN